MSKEKGITEFMIEGTNVWDEENGEIVFESFAAEFGSMLAGNVTASLAGDKALIGITPPTSIWAIAIKGRGTLHITLIIQMYTRYNKTPLPIIW
ncbi:hypothetical protein [Peribacillus frigoritolerans]|uniref:hypothetical protein n=1 Tax=Peribacillus castrilensis TaxID=2897690 RepID=UPI002DCF6527|nr:hypothetical protein [Peribacillus castrilensis]MEC0344396.1 hypothetical protein [Peribacillus castrilensis]